MDPRQSTSNVGSSGIGASQSRKERGAIAAQACELCRSRKQRCDEGKPKCSTCQKLGVECFYREPQPTKKDNTLQEILKRLTSLETKVDFVYDAFVGSQRRDVSLRPVYNTADSGEGDQATRPQLSSQHRTAEHEFFYTPSTKVMLEWPVMQHLPDISGAKGKAAESRIPPHLSGIVADIDEGQQPLGIEGIPSAPYSAGSSTPSSFPYSNPPVVQPSISPVIGWETAQPLSKSYFDTFNQLHPIVDEQWFMSNTIGHVLGVVESTPASALAFLVLALGEVALAGNAAPISQIGSRPSGIKGGTADQPPGLQFFNEARRRLGLFATEVSIQNLQVLCLTALFFASCGRSGDCWRTAASANIVCQALTIRVPEAHPSHELIKRLFYHCSEVTFVLGAELHLPITDLDHMRGYIGLPDFAGGQSEEDYLAHHNSQFRDYGQSQIFTNRFFSGLYSSLEHTVAVSVAQGKASMSSEAIREKIRYFNEQLERWRELLPQHLSWEDGNYLGFSPDEHSTQLLVSSNLIDTAMTYPYITMMQLALVRSQYWLGKHMILRYYIYKALHHPSDSLLPGDYRGAAECLKAALKWPITMAPPSMNKRLIPLPFFWSQNVCGVLVLLHISRQHPVLSHIRSTFCGGSHFEYDASETVDLYIQWLRDMRQICASSERCWRIIRQLYALRN